MTKRDRFETISLDQLEHATGGDGGMDIGSMIGQFGGMLDKAGVGGGKAGQIAQAAGPMINNIMSMIPKQG